MVFHITNYMRETNVWMIRKMRWILWGFVGATPLYRNTYWDFLNRRVAWRQHFFGGTEAEQQEYAESLVGNWGYKPRYEPAYEFSLKARKYEGQTELERVNDHPRLSPQGNMNEKRNKLPPGDVRMFTQIMLEHNREPGVFDYNYGQNFYSHHADIDQEAYLIVGARGSNYAHESYADGTIKAPEMKPF